MDPCDEFERIARNRPSPNIDPSLPKITDGTMAAIVQETPKRVIQQILSGLVKAENNPEIGPIADLILRHKLMRMYNRNGNTLQKQWNMLQKSMTYGVASSYTFFTSTNGINHTDFVIPYVKDSWGERGKVFMPDSNIRFMRSWYQKRDLQAIINRELNLQKVVKGYKSDWNLQALAEFMETGGEAKPAYLMTPAEKEKGGWTGGYEVIHALQKGIGATFYTFAPRFDKQVNLRETINKDPRGAMPVDDQYCNIDLSNPLGRGQIELSGGLQNLMDQQMQLYQFMSTMMQGPPLQTWGNVNKATLKFRPNAIWDMGTNANNKVEPFEVNNEQIKNFVPNMQFLQGKIYNINSVQDASISVEAGNVAQSKTAAGVKQQETRLGVSDNYLQGMSEEWFGKQCETSLNLYFANMKGTEEIDVGEQDIKDLATTLAAKYVTPDNKLKINYNDIKKAVYQFHIKAGSSKKDNDQDQLERLQALVQDIGSNGRVMSYYLGLEKKKLMIGDIYRQMFDRTGVENIDSILVDMTPAEAKAAAQAPFPILDPPHIRLDGSQLPPPAFQQMLAQAGINIPPEQAGGPSVGQSSQQVVSPTEKVTDALTIQFQQLPEDTQRALIQSWGLPANSPMPSQQQIGLQQDKQQQSVVENATKTSLEIAKTAHQQGMEIHKDSKDAVQPQQPVPDPTQPPQGAPGPNSNDQDPNQQQQALQLPQQLPPTNDIHDISSAAGDPTIPDPAQNGLAPQGPPQAANPGQLSPQENEVARQLIQHGFNDQDVEQAITMIRQGMPLKQVIQVLGAKRGQPPVNS
jgi:hypothetical protein